MKCIILCAAVCWLCFNSYGQIDTTKKPVDTTKKTIDTTQKVIDTVNSEPVQTDPVRFNASAANTSLSQPAPSANQEVYKLKPGVDIPVVIAGTAWSLYGFSKIYNKPSSTEAHILSLRKSDINGFDRWAADVYHSKAEKISDAPFYAAMPLPILLLFDADIRRDGWKYLFLYWETMAVTGVFYTGTAHIVDRYRPFVYNSAAPMHERTSGNAKNSFLGGHPALVASSTFFMAKVFADYHPDSKLKWLFYTVAAGATGTTAYLRHRSGKHFPSDLIVGVTVGTLTGILVPHFHKNKLIKNPNLSIRPFTGESHGVVVVYKL
jgi:membrane-associated phospholipid phosphatase